MTPNVTGTFVYGGMDPDVGDGTGPHPYFVAPVGGYWLRYMNAGGVGPGWIITPLPPPYWPVPAAPTGTHYWWKTGGAGNNLTGMRGVYTPQVDATGTVTIS